MEELRVDLAAFHGPLDLLLHLVQQEEVEVTEIPIARIADRFLEACRGDMESLDVDRAGEFLVMASQLLVLKSRALLPRDTELDIEEIDPRLDLVRQLLEYRDFKTVATTLAEQAEAESHKHQVRAMGPGRPSLAEEEIREVDLFVLTEAFQRLLRETGGDEAVAMPKERLPITHFVGQMFDHLIAAGGQLGFVELVGARPDRTFVIGAFLALLELIKLRKVLVVQDGFGEIQVQLNQEAMHVASAVDRDLAADAIDNPELAEEEAGPRIVFMGSPGFAVPVLRSLVGAGFKPRLVVTPPPKPSGRGRRVKPVAVAREADVLELPFHRTRDVNGRTSRSEIEAVAPDVIITAGFGQKLGSALLAAPPKGCLNVHASLLPRYRGASPIAAALRDGATETGVTIFRMDDELDHGPILAMKALPLTGDETADQVTEALGALGADLLVRTLGEYLDGKLEPKEQDHEAATYVGRLRKEDGVIQWDQPAAAVRNQIRSVTSWPGAQTAWQPRVKHAPFPFQVIETAVLDAEATDAPVQETNAGEDETPPETRPGTVVAVGKEGIDVRCGEGVLRILSVRPSGKRVMAVKDFLNARRVVPGDRFVAPPKEG